MMFRSVRALMLPSAENYALGVLTGDFNGDGWPDITWLAIRRRRSCTSTSMTDTSRTRRYSRGVAFDENGRALSGMGVAARIPSGSGLMDLFRTNFSDERETLYRDRGGGEFEDITRSAGMGVNTRYVGWGCGFFDFDNDGWADLLLVNGHVFPEVERLGNDLHFKRASPSCIGATRKNGV